MIEDQKVEILVGVERLLKKSLLDTNTTQILEAAQELESAFFWANSWIVIAVIIFSIAIYMALVAVYHSAKNELFERVNIAAADVVRDIEPLVKATRANNAYITKYTITLLDHTEYLSSVFNKVEESLDIKSKEVVQKIEEVANDANEAIRTSRKIQIALEEEIESNQILRKEILKQRNMLEKKEKKIIALSGVGYQQ